MSLTEKQKRYLRGLGNRLKPIVLIGQHGIDESVLSAITNAVATHELIKIKLLESYAGNRQSAAEELALKTKTELVQVLGKTILLYKSAEKPKIQVPS
jgi:RNA-binding protein